MLKSIKWLRSIQTDEDIKKNSLICLRMAIVLSKFFRFDRKKRVTMDLLCLLSDGSKIKPAKAYRDEETKIIKSRTTIDQPRAEVDRKKRREKAGKALSILEKGGYIIVDRTSGKQNKIQLIMKC